MAIESTEEFPWPGREGMKLIKVTGPLNVDKTDPKSTNHLIQFVAVFTTPEGANDFWQDVFDLARARWRT